MMFKYKKKLNSHNKNKFNCISEVMHQRALYFMGSPHINSLNYFDICSQLQLNDFYNQISSFVIFPFQLEACF